MSDQFPDAYFGSVSTEPTEDWQGQEDADPDDEELEETPKDVVEMLGFDPLEDSELPKAMKDALRKLK